MGRRDIADIGRAEALGEGPILPWLKHTSRDLKLWIVAGTLPLPPVDQPTAKVHACSLLVDDQGETVARYDKLHLFDVDVADNRGRYRESDDYAFWQWCGGCRHARRSSRSDRLLRLKISGALQ